MKQPFGRLYDFVIPSIPEDDVDLLRKHKLFVNTCLFTAFFGFAYGVISYNINFFTGIWTMALSVVFFIVCIFLLKYIPINPLGLIVSLYIVWLNGILIYYSGGLFTSPVSPWITLTAPIVILLTNKRIALFIVFLCLIEVLIYFIALKNGYEFPFTYAQQFHLPFLTMALAGLVVIFFLITNTFENLKQQALDSLVEKQKELQQEQQRSEKLLLNIFPKDIANELKNTGKSEARLHENVTVLFADVKDFTIVSEGLSPKMLVQLLDAYFQRIDGVIQKHGLEKIKTIGDAYLAASGVPKANTASVENVIDVALEIQASNEIYKAKQLEKGMPFFDFRIGVHTGTVVAGVVGDRKYVYDIWGDTVNIAARIEQASQPGKINISESTYALIRDTFKCEARGKIYAKNKGEIDMYWVNGRSD